MNERIRLLADEAGLRFTQLMSNPMVPVVDGKEADLEKFALLIVRECARVGERYADGNYEVRNQILEHFGLEEE